jgi:hypothetical protein
MSNCTKIRPVEGALIHVEKVTDGCTNRLTDGQTLFLEYVKAPNILRYSIVFMKIYHYEYGKELLGSIKCGEFLDYLRRLVSFLRGTLLHGVSKKVSKYIINFTV